MRKFLVVVLCLCTICMSVTLTASAEKSDALEIYTAEEFLAFAEKCRLDSFSKDLTVELKADIDLSGTDFSTVPSFSGTFNGNGHTVSGVTVNEEGSVQGFFRYITKGAVVRNLTVSGKVLPEGSRCTVGAIAGSNSGSIISCTFYGTVSGVDDVGGIAGINESDGVIKDCTVKGTIYGSHFVGGVVGENRGTVYECVNYAEVNTAVQQNSVEISDITLDSLTNSESASTVTDIGGIAGGNTGTIRSCHNRASIGYKHIGYNIGGIAGSQSGYIFACTNTGNISGRKEIGGIVGQIEPATLVEFSEDTIQILQEQFDKVDYLTNQAAAEVQSGVTEMTAQIESLQEQSQDAQNALGVLLENISDPDNMNFDSIMSAQNVLSSSLTEMMETVQGMGDDAGENVSALGEELQAIGDQLGAAGDAVQNAEETMGVTVVDVSDEDTASDTSSKVEKCQNMGTILADLNAGGIVGAMSIENDLDHEDDVELSGEQSANVATKLRAVVLSCENSGSVTAKKQNAGGIVGWMSLGLVKECVNTGSMESEGADYVGAVAGQSTGYIRACNAKCKISGDRYIGGIAGTAETVSDCRSMILLVSGAEKIGSVIGYTEDRTEIKRNFYWSAANDLGGIDGISYDGSAQPLDDEFFALEGLNSVFKTVTVSFIFEDGSVENISIETGGEISAESIPEIPEKDGYNAHWQGLDGIDLSSVGFDAVCYAVYTSKHSAAQSSTLRSDGRPILIVQGTVENDKEIVISEITDEITLPTQQEVIEAWSYDLSDNSVIYSLRFLPEEIYGEEDISVFTQKENGEWEEADFSVSGSYIVFETAEVSGSFCIAEALPDYTRLIRLAVGVGCIIILVMIFLCRRAIKKKKTK